MELLSLVRPDGSGGSVEESLDSFCVLSVVYERTDAFLDEIARKHIGDITLQSVSGDDADFLLLGCDNEEDSVIFPFLSDLIGTENLHGDVENLIPVAIRNQDNDYLICGLGLVIARRLAESREICRRERIREILYEFRELREVHRIDRCRGGAKDTGSDAPEKERGENERAKDFHKGKLCYIPKESQKIISH